jgi:hypothetical protein
MQSVAPILIFILGAIVGAVLAYIICSRAHASEVTLRAENARQLENAFEALSVDVLRGNSKEFLQLAHGEQEPVPADPRSLALAPGRSPLLGMSPRASVALKAEQ